MASRAETHDAPRGSGSRPSERPLNKAARQWAPPLLVLAVIVAVWLFLTYVVLEERQRFLLPPPQDVLMNGLLTWRNLSEVLIGLLATTQVAMVGLAIAMALGVVLAILMSQARSIERSLYPYAVVLQTIPILALVPLIGFWFGFNFWSRVIVVVLFSLFPIITNTLFGLQSVSSGLNDLFTLHRAGRFSRLWRLQLPAAMPAMFAGFRISAGLSVIGAIVGDFFFRQGKPGIGRLIDLYAQRLETEQLFTAILFSSILGIVVFWSFGFIGHRVVRSWYDPSRSSP
jgi:NitT/TauT family transport system permease protein